METRLSRICDAIIEAGWLAALVVTPLFFNTHSNRVFEPDKLHLLRSIALVMAVAWIVQLLDQGVRRQLGVGGTWTRLRETPLALPALALTLSYLLSTALSVAPRISFFGSYVRMQGAFSFLSYVVIFALVLTHLRSRSQLQRLLHTVILTSLPIAIYGIIQKGGLDPLPWGGDVRDRVAANMGNAIFVAAYLIIAVFLTLERLLNSLATMLNAEDGAFSDAFRAGGYLFVLIVQLITIVFTQSRGPWLGLAAGVYVFIMLGLLLLARWATGRARVPGILDWLSGHLRAAWLSLIGLTVAGLIILVTLNVPNGPLQGACEARYVGRLCTLFSTTEGTNAVRVLIWDGVVDLMLKPHAPIQQPDGTPDTLNILRPLIGYGPESMWVAYNRFYPPDLAHYEARNASPDRSHNETFDALVRGGLVQFAAQLFLFGSIFYYALRWLGLMRQPGRRRLFIGLLTAGGALGVLLPVIFDGSLRLAGIGLPAGLIAGMIVYVTLDLLLSPQKAVASEAAPDTQSESGQRQLLILTLFAAIVAHYLEVHFGIAIASTQTHLWVLAAVLVVVGMGWLQQPHTTVPAPEPIKVTPKPPIKGKQAQAAGRRTQATRTTVAATPTRTAQPRQAAVRPFTAFLPYVGIGALITLVLVYNYTVNQTDTTSPLAILWNAFTTRINDFQVIRSPMLLVMVFFTWLLGGIFAAAESARREEPGRFPWALAISVYATTVVITFLGYGLIQAGRLTLTGLSGLAALEYVTNHIVIFDIVLFAAMLALAGLLIRADARPWPAQTSGGVPALTLGGGVIAAVLGVLIIINVNVQTVQADTYYKQGLGYEAAGQWEGAVILYREAARLEPQEDYYYLFLGRALLQLADSGVATATPILPENLDNVATADLLNLVEQGLRTRGREDILRAAHAALVAARRLNPLNTDHSANLARLHRVWAFADAATTGSATSNRLRELMLTQPDKVNMARLERSEMYYNQAIMLSPQNAGLWNELATVQLIRNDLAGAQASLERSLALDPKFYSTYLLQGDVREASGDMVGALAAFRRAGELAPGDINVQSAIGVYSAQTGDTAASLVAFHRIIEQATKALQDVQTQLVRLDTLASQAGGYSRLQPAAASRRETLQGQIAAYKTQLQLAYRNTALVLRDAGRINEAVEAAQQALTFASENERPVIENLIADLKAQSAP